MHSHEGCQNLDHGVTELIGGAVGVNAFHKLIVQGKDLVGSRAVFDCGPGQQGTQLHRAVFYGGQVVPRR